MSLFSELRRRNIFRVGAAYVLVAWLVIQVVETILPAFGFGDAAVRVVTIAFAAGIVPVLVFTWVFEWTPEGLKLDRDVEYDPAANRKASKRLDRVILVVLALALGYFAFDRFVLVPEQTARQVEAAREAGRSEGLIGSYGDQSIAVLAFDDLSPEGDQEYFAQGISEEVLNLLARIPELRVISRSSAFSYKDKDVAIPVIAEQLNVAHILEGSVRKSGDRVRITAQLIEAASDRHLWSETYDRELGDIFAIQDELAAALVEQLELTLLGEAPHVEPIDPEAYDLYLQAKYFEDTYGRDKAAELLEKVVKMEPEFVDAWAELSEMYIFTAPSLGSPDHEGDPVWARAMETRERVAALDPDHPFILTTSGWATIEMAGDYAAAAAIYERAINQYPENLDVLDAAANYASLIRHDDIAIALARIIVGRDPLCSRCAYRYARLLTRAGRYDDAEQAILRYLTVLPATGGELTLGTVRLVAGDLEGAQAAFSQREDEIGRQYGALLVKAARGEDQGLKAAIDEFAAAESYLHPWGVAHLYAMAGEVDAAFEWLEEASKQIANWQLGFELLSPLLSNLHSDPRWLKLAEQAGVAPRQLETIEFDPRLSSAAKGI